MADDAICDGTIETAAALIKSRELSPVELTEMVLARVERLSRLNAYITVMGEQALTEARTAEQEIAGGHYRGALHGVPIAHKDLFDTKGVRTTAGMKIFADRVPDADAAAVERLRAAGAICGGKLNMHEAAFGTTSANVHYGYVRNPWDEERIPGGSSGGSGTAVAGGMAFAATGSDTGGSIRIPASECGCVGLMPTYGRVSLRGAVALSWSLDHAGPLTRSVRDAAILLQALAGYDAGDPCSVDAPAPDYLDGIERGARGLRIGVPRNYFWDKIDPTVEGASRGAIADLERAGAEVREVEYEPAVRYTTAAGPIILAEAAAYHQAWLASRREEYGPLVAQSLDMSDNVTAVALADAMRVMQIARAGEADAALDGVDVLAVPTVPETPPLIEDMLSGFREVRRTAFTSLFDVTGQPVLTVPCALLDGHLPVGISFVARRWDERSALRAGRALELVRGPFPTPSIS